jgi:hypothetical protein
MRAAEQVGRVEARRIVASVTDLWPSTTDAGDVGHQPMCLLRLTFVADLPIAIVVSSTTKDPALAV